MIRNSAMAGDPPITFPRYRVGINAVCRAHLSTFRTYLTLPPNGLEARYASTVLCLQPHGMLLGKKGKEGVFVRAGIIFLPSLTEDLAGLVSALMAFRLWRPDSLASRSTRPPWKDHRGQHSALTRKKLIGSLTESSSHPQLHKVIIYASMPSCHFHCHSHITHLFFHFPPSDHGIRLCGPRDTRRVMPSVGQDHQCLSQNKWE